MKWTDKNINLVRGYLQQGKTMSEISALMQLSYKTIESAIARYGLAKYRMLHDISVKTPKSMEEIDIKQLIKENTLNWKILKSKKGKHQKPFKSYLIIADTHIPYQNIFVLNSIWKLMEDITFDGFIVLGDYMDMTPISHWMQDKNKHKSLENKRMLSDYIIGNQILDEFDKRLPKCCDKRYFYGNHERFYYDMIEKFPALEGLLDPKIELKLKERNYITYDEINHVERLGRLNLTHGIYASANVVKKHIDELKTNVMFGHVHSPEMRLAHSPAREIAISGYALGCTCDMAPAYMQGRPHNWSHGFAIVYLYENGYFDVDLKRIIDGKFIFNNKCYNGGNK